MSEKLYLGYPAEYDKYRHLPFDTDTFQCRLLQSTTDNDAAKPLCEDCNRISREVWGRGLPVLAT